MEKKKEGLARLMELAGQKKGLLILAGILSAGSALFMLTPYWAVYEVIKELLLSKGDFQAIDKEAVTHWAWIGFGGLSIGLILLYVALMASHVAAFRVLYGLRVKLTEHLGKLPLGYLNNTSTGSIKKTMEQNIEKIELFIAHTIPDLVGIAATIIFMFTICFSLNGWMAAACLLCILISLGLQFSNFMGKRAKAFTKQYYDTQEEMSASAVQYVRGIPVVKIFSQSVKSFQHFNNEILNYKKWALKVCNTYEWGFVGFTVTLNSILTFILPVGILLLSGQPQNISLAAVWLFFVLMGPGITSPIYKLMHLGGSTQEINEGVSRIDKIFAEPILPQPTDPQIPTTYDIVFKEVTFEYENTTEKTRTIALDNLSFKARQGEITAIVGPSGSGKSTVANLIPRFWDVTKGEISIGGINIKQIATEELMDMISFVFQDNFLFYDTLFENIAVGNSHATQEQIIEAAKAAQCHDFIMQLPNGYQTRIGDKGVYLSGGESQRVCVARAILKNAPILVLDEATAFADPENEYKMQMALKQLIQNKTVIIIAHRLSSIISSNKIVVLKDGQRVEEGMHDELLSIDGLYGKMWKAYQNAFQWELSSNKKKVAVK